MGEEQPCKMVDDNENFVHDAEGNYKEEPSLVCREKQTTA
jgi:hypothetical protein